MYQNAQISSNFPNFNTLNYSFYFNIHGIKFLDYLIYESVESMIYHFYQCYQCKRIYLSKTSVAAHNCLTPKSSEEFRSFDANWELIFFICLKGIPIHDIENAHFVKFCKYLNPNYLVPKHKKPRSMILEMAKYMINDTFQQLQFEKYPSIMIDGSTKYYHYLVFVLIYSHDKMYFYSINN